MLAILDLLGEVLEALSWLSWLCKGVLWLVSADYREEIRRNKPDKVTGHKIGAAVACLLAVAAAAAVAIFSYYQLAR